MTASTETMFTTITVILTSDKDKCSKCRKLSNESTNLMQQLITGLLFVV
jgi:hypothetical protein